MSYRAQGRSSTGVRLVGSTLQVCFTLEMDLVALCMLSSELYGMFFTSTRPLAVLMLRSILRAEIFLAGRVSF